MKANVLRLLPEERELQARGLEAFMPDYARGAQVHHHHVRGDAGRAHLQDEGQ